MIVTWNCHILWLLQCLCLHTSAPIYRRFFLLQSKFYTTSNRSTSGCRKDDTWTVLSSRRTAAVLWTCRTFTVDLPFPVRRYRWHILMRILSSFHKSINFPIRMLGYQHGSYKLRKGHGLQTWYSDWMAILSPLYNLVLHCLLFQLFSLQLIWFGPPSYLWERYPSTLISITWMLFLSDVWNWSRIASADSKRGKIEEMEIPPHTLLSLYYGVLSTTLNKVKWTDAPAGSVHQI